MPKKQSQKQPAALKVDYAVLCEDIRMERNNKVMLAGIYTGSILVAQFPATLRLGVWFHCETALGGTYDIEAKMEAGGPGANKEKATVLNGKMAFVVKQDPHGTEAAFALGGAIVKIQGAGPLRAFIE